jgi:hypothetical protein
MPGATAAICPLPFDAMPLLLQRYLFSSSCPPCYEFFYIGVQVGLWRHPALFHEDFLVTSRSVSNVGQNMVKAKVFFFITSPFSMYQFAAA